MKKINTYLFTIILLTATLSLNSNTPEKLIFDTCSEEGWCKDQTKANCTKKKKDICVVSVACQKRRSEYSGGDEELLPEIL